MDEPEICLIMRRCTVGGIERVVLLLANALAERGRKVHVAVLEPVGLRAIITELHPQVSAHVLSGSRSSRLRRLRELTRGRITHLHLADGRIHPSLRWVLRGHPGVFVTYHMDYTPARNRVSNLVDRLITGRCRAVIAVSQVVRDFCLNAVRLPADLVTVIENAVPGPSAGRVRIESDDAFTLVALATVNPHKNHVGLLRGFALARGRGHDVRLRIIGDGPAIAEVFTAAAELGVGSAVEWYGALWQSTIVSALLSTSDAFVSASRDEGLPMAVLEGLQHGLPMVLSDIPAHREAAGEAGVYFDSEDPEQFADRLEELLDPGACRRRAAAAISRSALFGLDRFAARHLELYGTAPLAAAATAARLSTTRQETP
ncbi:hypothetical protein GCM10018793_58390 [Streptomyces sulfonofaciens]|uniref:D-inositol 3-phosphate glycosyltransferase n=1 Tax=Streptomyces sulfonofaciens TaxID=68272 RepID=A0A919GL65_9ACTN|nr:glycosyltransferase family 4 protein [Streptomyces sulfonofaciens]GHH86451.1 hypothetical protein GCM10018793_58390 [Streptomyces sulfonofaciens]